MYSASFCRTFQTGLLQWSGFISDRSLRRSKIPLNVPPNVPSNASHIPDKLDHLPGKLACDVLEHLVTNRRVLDVFKGKHGDKIFLRTNLIYHVLWCNDMGIAVLVTQRHSASYIHPRLARSEGGASGVAPKRSHMGSQ